MSQINLKASIVEAMKVAMKAQEKERLAVIRLILAELKQVEVDKRIELDEEMILSILDKMVRQRKESIKQFDAANRMDLSQKEQFELGIIQTFMPPPLSDSEILTYITEAITETGAQSIRDMAKVMAVLKPKVQGKTDMNALGNLIKSRLTT
ncbi:MAG: GatB/YqeY protein [Francisellaceae bacterium]|nr:GatB/YqeY protein [Francisellaceae bacterium]